MTFKDKIKVIQKMIWKLLNQPSSIFLILKDENEYLNHLQKKYGRVNFPTVDISYFLKNRTSEINHYTFLEGGSLITDLALLKSIASNFEKCDYLEIGTWRGESIVNVADVKGTQCTSINLSPEEIIKLGLPEKYANEHGLLIKNRKNIKQIHANSLHFDFTSLDQKFDLIFVDGDHTYNAVKSDTRNVIQLLKDENSIIVWHDYGFDPVTPRYSVISAILDGIPNEFHSHLYHVSNTMCAIFTKQNFNSFVQKESEKPDKVFKIQITTEQFE